MPLSSGHRIHTIAVLAALAGAAGILLFLILDSIEHPIDRADRHEMRAGRQRHSLAGQPNTMPIDELGQSTS